MKSKLSSRFSYIQIPTSEFIMSISKCVVRLKDRHDTEHSVEVYAESLYEAVLRGWKEIRGLEQNPETKSRWAWLARSGKKVMQFLSVGRYVANVADGKVTRYGRAR